MKSPEKLQAKLEKAEARAVRHLAALRAKAEKKIARIQEALRADEADVHARLDADRAKYTAKLERLTDKAPEGNGKTRLDRPRPKTVRAGAVARARR